MDGRVFVSSEANVADLAGLLSGDGGFEGSVGGEDAVGVFHADDFVELNEVYDVGLEAAQGLFELGVVGGFGPTVHFGHEEDFLPVAIAEGLPHADFADAVVVVPTVVEEGDAFVDG